MPKTSWSLLIKEYNSLPQILADRKLASLGDAYVNFVYSLALSQRKGRPSGVKVKGTALAEALRKAGSREHLPSRIDKHVSQRCCGSVVSLRLAPRPSHLGG